MLLQPEYVRERECLLFSKKVLKFALTRRYWPTAIEIHQRYKRGCNFSKRACVLYARYAIEKGYLELDQWKHLRLTKKYYLTTNAEVVEPSLPSHPAIRKAVKRTIKKRIKNAQSA
jgi:hypothetical protein